MPKFINYTLLAGVIMNLIVLLQRNKENSKLIGVAKVFNNETLKDNKSLRKVSLVTVIILLIIFLYVKEMWIDFNIIKDFAEERSIKILDLFKNQNKEIYQELWTKSYEKEILESVSYLKIKIYYLFSLLTLTFLTILNFRVRIEYEGFRVFKDLYPWENCKGYYWTEDGDLALVSKEDYILLKARFGERDRENIEVELKKIIAEL